MILYSFRRCPYAMRARMALLYAGVTFELREVILKNKPVEMLAISPKGTVPVLQLDDGSVIDESLDIMRRGLEQADVDGWLKPESDTIADMLALIRINDNEFKHHLDRYKYPDRFGPESDPLHHRQKAAAFLTILECALNKHAFLFGDQISMADIAIFPFVRQFAHTDRDWFSDQPWVALQRWLKLLISSDLFKQAMAKHAAWKPAETD